MQPGQTHRDTGSRPLPLKKLLYYLVFIIPAGVCINIVFSYYTVSGGILKTLARCRPDFLLLAAVLAVVPWFTHALRMHMWIRMLGRKLSFFELFYVSLGTDLGSALSPTAVGGSYVKGGLLMQKRFSAGTSASLMTMGAIEEVVFFMLALPVALICTCETSIPAMKSLIPANLSLVSSLRNVSYLAAFALCSLIALQWFFGTSRRGKKFFLKTVAFMKSQWHDFMVVWRMITQRGKTRFAINIVLTAVQFFCRYSVVTAVLLSLGVGVKPVALFFLQFLIFAITIFIPTPGGAVGAESGFYFLHETVIAPDILGPVTLLWRFISYYFVLILGSAVFTLLHCTAAADGDGPQLNEPVADEA